MTADAEHEFIRGTQAHAAGDHNGAVSGFLMALALAPHNRRYQQAALSILGKTTGYSSLPDPVLSALAACAQDESLDAQPLAMVVRTLLAHHPQRPAWLEAAAHAGPAELEAALAGGGLDDLLADQLVQSVLARAVNISLDLEDILTALRRHATLVTANAQSTCLLTSHAPFFDALCRQAQRTEYAWLVSDEEKAALDRLRQSVTGRRVLRAYEGDPEPALDFPDLTPVSDAVSKRVQAQYVAFPYPRWERLEAADPMSYSAFLRSRFPNEPVSERFSGEAQALSAGCGTGRGAATLAMLIAPLSLTAIDLSPTSLTFAKRKFDELGYTNATFGIGDILNVDALDQTFDLIECSGVLHHMADPAAGLAALVSVLQPDGFMRIALYSERARMSVVAARTWLAEQNVADTPDGVRHVRSALRALPASHPARGVVDTPEFFILSGLHDLIFNTQEHRFTPRQLKTMLDGASLRFLGFDHANPATTGAYARAYPDDPHQTDLDNWEMFEQNHPDTFAEMFQFWARPQEV